MKGRLTVVGFVTALLLSGSMAIAQDRGPRELSRAFREASRRAGPSVVTIIAYGQSTGGPNEKDAERTDKPANPSNSGESGSPSNSGETGGGENDGNKPAPIDPNVMPPMPSVEGMNPTGIGSGVIVTTDGIVITNHHVVEGARRVRIRLADGLVVDGTDIRSDRASDVATLRIVAEPFPPLTAATLGSSDNLEIGDWVLAIGSPFELDATVSQGIISAKGRWIPRLQRAQLLQTDAAVNPGNSGGPLINLDGEVIGINTAISTNNGSFMGVGFAIPIEQVRWVSGELLAFGTVRRASIGIQAANVDGEVARRLGVPSWRGVYVHRVIDNSPAKAAGLQPKDIIRSVAGRPVNERGELTRALEQMPVGSEQAFEVQRGETLLVLRVKMQAANR
jgi:serine protease Do